MSTISNLDVTDTEAHIQRTSELSLMACNRLEQSNACELVHKLSFSLSQDILLAKGNARTLLKQASEASKYNAA